MDLFKAPTKQELETRAKNRPKINLKGKLVGNCFVFDEPIPVLTRVWISYEVQSLEGKVLEAGILPSI